MNDSQHEQARAGMLCVIVFTIAFVLGERAGGNGQSRRSGKGHGERGARLVECHRRVLESGDSGKRPACPTIGAGAMGLTLHHTTPGFTSGGGLGSFRASISLRQLFLTLGYLLDVPEDRPYRRIRRPFGWC